MKGERPETFDNPHMKDCRVDDFSQKKSPDGSGGVQEHSHTHYDGKWHLPPADAEKDAAQDATDNAPSGRASSPALDAPQDDEGKGWSATHTTQDCVSSNSSD